MVKIHVPEDIGSDLRVVPEGTYKAIVKKFIPKMSTTSNQPKLVCRLTIQSEAPGKHGKDYISTIGETILDDFSLQEQAIWKLNSLYKQITNERIPMGDYTHEQFAELMNEHLGGAEVNIDVYTDDSQGDERSKIKQYAKA